MKFGAVPSQADITWGDLVDTWQELDERSNFDSLWLMDHFVTGAGQEFGSTGPCMEGWTALAGLAQATSHKRLGILVTGNTYRHPAVLAKQATTVDHISNGRLVLGIGAAWHEYEHGAFGLGNPALPSAKERLDRLEEAVDLIKALWTEERPRREGDYYSLDRPPYNPPNVQQPHPPILIGGGGEKRTLRIVAKYADAANVSGNPDEVAHKFKVLEEHCRELGRDPASITRTIQAPLWLSDDPDFKARVAQAVAGVRGESPGEAVKSVLLGSADEVRRQVQAFKDAGVEEIYLAQWPRIHMESLRTFSEKVAPEFM